MGATIVVIVAPIMAPTLVNISRYMATFTLVILSLTNEEAAPLEVAIIATIDEAIASLTGMPRKTRMGIRILAPPRPVNAPIKPTIMEIRSKVTMSSTADIYPYKLLVSHYVHPLIKIANAGSQ